MKVSLNWLKDYVDLPSDVTVSKIMYDLTMTTVEVEGADVVRDRFSEIAVGKIIEVLPHPNADKLRICKTDVGGGDIKDIVCGGSNLAPGMKVAVSKPGAIVRWHGQGDPVEVKVAKLRGVESYGMICASTEIGLFDLFPFEEEATILDLSSFDAETGTNVAEAIGIDDVIFEIDNKSLTNRPDLWGHYGIARELAAIYDAPLREIAPSDLPSVDGGLRVKIDDSSRCARYVGLAIDGVSVKPSSFKVQSRIWLVGMRPINALVDITNYVMLATGQPTHAFDRDNIKGGITVRRASDGEKIALLNGRDVELCEEDLVIADDVEAVALAGIMGGSKDSILPTTTRVILEAANFDALGTRRTASRADVRTEASMRFEKAIDPQRIDQAVALSIAMFAEAYPEMKAVGCVDVYPSKPAKKNVNVSLDWLARRIGKTLSNDEVRNVLSRLGFEVAISGDELNVVVPSWRSTGDVSLPDDIMEEVARLYGYENFIASPITTSFVGAINQPKIDLTRKIKEYLSFRCGMNEIFTYPWVRDELLDAVGADRSKMMEISTPPAPDERFVRSSIAPGLLGAVADNARYFEDLRVYELTEVFSNEKFSSQYDEREKLPIQRRHLGAAIASSAASPMELFRAAKGVVENMARITHAESLAFEQKDRPHWADATAWLNVTTSDGDVIGAVAIVAKKTSLACGAKQHTIAMFEIDVDAMIPLSSRTNKFEHVSEFPQIEYDISMIFDDKVKWSDISSAAITEKDARNAEWLVRSVSFVDEYRGKQIPQGKKSITLRLVIGSPKKTLTGDEIERAAGAVSKRLVKALGGEMRA